MPTIEVASINSSGLHLTSTDFRFAFTEESKLVSRKGLFYDFLIRQQETIIHLGDADIINAREGGDFAGQLFHWDFDADSNFKFLKE